MPHILDHLQVALLWKASLEGSLSRNSRLGNIKHQPCTRHLRQTCRKLSSLGAWYVIGGHFCMPVQHRQDEHCSRSRVCFLRPSQEDYIQAGGVIGQGRRGLVFKVGLVAAHPHLSSLSGMLSPKLLKVPTGLGTRGAVGCGRSSWADTLILSLRPLFSDFPVS